MRGKLYVAFLAHYKSRITPAGAGKTTEDKAHEHSNQDHPRRCGENYEQLVGGVETLGSPPQVRGKLASSIFRVSAMRITPAGAGKTVSFQTFGDISEDHPRRCGENSMSLSSRTTKVGSPPQVRGKQRPFLGGYLPHGITPAGAGKTTIFRPASLRARDHPRRCGENAPVLSSCRQRPGSPPQVRGKLGFWLSLRAVLRITPAGAGKTPTADGSAAAM